MSTCLNVSDLSDLYFCSFLRYKLIDYFENLQLIAIISASGVGLAIYSAISLLNSFQVGVHQSAEAENHMTSVERVIEYTSIESEADLESMKTS